jgi:hypothetical protein
MFNIFVFSIQKNKNARTEQQLDIKILLNAIKDKPSRISRNKQPTQDARTINENDDKKGTTQKFNQRNVSYHSTSN